LKEQVNYINGLRNGVYRSYYESGELCKEFTYGAKGNANGEYKSNHKNGQVYVEMAYIDGKQVGKCKTHNKKGELV